MQAVMFPVALLSLKCDVKAEFVNTESTAKVLLNFLSVICAKSDKENEIACFRLYRVTETQQPAPTGFHNHITENNEQFNMRFLVNYGFSFYSLVPLEDCEHIVVL